MDAINRKRINNLWMPDEKIVGNSNLGKFLKEKGWADFRELHRWSVENYSDFWGEVVEKLGIVFDKPYEQVVELSRGFEAPNWFFGGQLNIINSCFKKENDNRPAIIYGRENGDLETFTYDQLDKFSDLIAKQLLKHFKKDDCIAIIMPMHPDAVAIYLGIIKAGLVVVSIADSFSAEEIGERLKIANVKAVFTQDTIARGGKVLPLYEKINMEERPFCIVLERNDVEDGKNCCQSAQYVLRQSDSYFKDFINSDGGEEDLKFQSISCDPNDFINILFSSGTTGAPKAIPWAQTTAIKCAMDAYFHQDVQEKDVFCWPSNLGWMMGPWLIFACLLNRATLAIYEGLPTVPGFGKFVQEAGVTQLGVVPTVVKTWRNTRCMEEFDWSKIKLFTSTGECSNENDMAYLMELGKHKPVIEYCGGTEIGGGYITGTVVQPALPGKFSTAALGLDFKIVNEEGSETDNGEVLILTPSIGLSTMLLNKDHHKVYFEGVSKRSDGRPFRRHGDQVEHLANGYFRLHGRVDDTMNLSGIKISAAEIETVLNSLDFVYETATIAVEPEGGGPSELRVYVVLRDKDKVSYSSLELQQAMQIAIKQHLNPLFKIHKVIIIENLPRTASNKIMRRLLRDTG